MQKRREKKETRRQNQKLTDFIDISFKNEIGSNNHYISVSDQKT